MNIFDAERYTISVRKEIVEGDELYVARVTELQDVEEYADSRAEAYALAIDTIETAHELCLEKGITFPEPAVHDYRQAQASGRITLRIPKTLHANLVTKAAYEGVSLNTLIVSELSAAYSQKSMYEKITKQLDNKLNLFNEGMRSFTNTTKIFFMQPLVEIGPSPVSNFTFNDHTNIKWTKDAQLESR